MTVTLRATAKSFHEVRQELQKVRVLIEGLVAQKAALESDLDELSDRVSGIVENSFAGQLLVSESDGYLAIDDEDNALLLSGGNLGEAAEASTSKLLINDDGDYLGLETGGFLKLSLGRSRVQTATYEPERWWI